MSSQDDIPSFSDTTILANDDGLVQSEFEAAALATSLSKVQAAWIAERGCPEILNFEADAVADLQTRLKERQEDLDELTEEGTPNTLQLYIYQMDLDRANFVLASYLRTRLAKIEKFITFIMLPESAEQRQRLSPHEKKFAASYLELMSDHFNESFLNQLNPDFRSLKEKAMVEKPNLSNFVCIRVKVDLGAFAITDQETVMLKKDDTLIAPYDRFRSLILQGDVELI